MRSVVDAVLDPSLSTPEHLSSVLQVKQHLPDGITTEPLFADAQVVLRATGVADSEHLKKHLNRALQSVFPVQSGGWDLRVVTETPQDTAESILRDVLPALMAAGSAPGADHELLLGLAERVRKVLQRS